MILFCLALLREPLGRGEITQPPNTRALSPNTVKSITPGPAAINFLNWVLDKQVLPGTHVNIKMKVVAITLRTKYRKSTCRHLGTDSVPSDQGLKRLMAI